MGFLKIALILVLALSLVPVVSAQPSTTVGALELAATYESISVYANFQGDDDTNNFASFRWRESGGFWKQGMAMTVDRRATVDGVTNVFQNQWRASILMVKPNTEYEVEVTFTDGSVSGTNPAYATITTRNDAIPLGIGDTYYVSPSGTDSGCTNGNTFSTIQQAATCANAGDTVYIRAGTYTEQVTISYSGTENNWITFMNYGSEVVTIDGQGTRGNVVLNNNVHHVRIKGLRFINGDGGSGAAFIVGNRNSNILIEDNYFSGFNGPAIKVGTTYNGLNYIGNITIQHNEIIRTSKPTVVDAYSISIWNANDGGHVIRNNIIRDTTNNFPRPSNYYDGIAGFREDYYGFVHKNSDIYNNIIEDFPDDAIQSEGGNINVRIWNNTLKNNFIGIAHCPVDVGPLYVFRNIVEITAPQYRESFNKLGCSTTGYAYVYHNTFYTTEAYTGFSTTNPGLQNLISRNNIIHAGRYTIEFYPDGDGQGLDFNYDNLYTTDPSRFAKWGGITGPYNSFSNFQSNTNPNQELNGMSISATNEFVNAANGDFHLLSDSQFSDQGEVLVGFNDQDSPWPYKGAAPDIGAYEFDSGYVSTTTSLTSTSTTSTIGSTTTSTISTTTTIPGGGSPTTIGELEIYATIENIGVRSNFVGDDDGNNNAILEYREVGSPSWEPGIAMTVDRREYYNDPTAPQLNPWKDQWRVVIFWLTINTQYEVRITYSDPDGVSGGTYISPTEAYVSGNVTTRDANPPSNGINYYLSPTGNDANDGLTPATARATAMSIVPQLAPGDVVNFMPGRYNEQVSLTGVSGLSTNYITFQSYDMNDKAVIDAENSLARNFYLSGSSYIRISGLILHNATKNNIGLYSASNYVIIEDSILSSSQTSWAEGGIMINWGGNPPVIGTLIQRNEISHSGFRGQSMGIFFYNNAIHDGGYVIRDNTITGTFYDAIGGEPNGAPEGTVHANSFIYNNYIEGSYDDGIEIEGAGINSAVWNNTIKNSHNMGFGVTPVQIGPLYIFRNTIIDWETDAGIKMGGHGDGYTYFYHNTFFSTYNVVCVGDYGHTNVVDNFVFRNNIFVTSHHIINQGVDANDYGYDLLWRTDSSPNSLIRYGPGYPNNMYTLEEWQSLFGQGLHSINANPQFVNSANDDFALQATSPGIDAGVVLSGFNDANSPWPYCDSAPDMGAFEYGTCAPSPTTTTSTTTTTSSSTTTASNMTSTTTSTISTTTTIAPITTTIVSSGGGGGYIPSGSYVPEDIEIGNVTVGNITENVTETEAGPSLVEKGEIALQIVDAPDSIESGEPYDVTISLKANRAYYNLKLRVADKEEIISLSKDIEKLIAFELIAPEAKGSFNLVANITAEDTASIVSKLIELDYKPLFLYTKLDGNKLAITLKTYEEQSETELEITRDKSNVYVDYIRGKKDYKANLELIKPGEYKILAKMRTPEGIVDSDLRTVIVEGVAGIEYGNVILVVIVIGIIVASLFLFRKV